MVKVVTVDMTGNYIPIIKILFTKAKIVLDCFHIVQHMSKALNKTRIQIMKQFPRKSMEYRTLKYYWKLIQKDSRKLSLNSFYSKTFREILTPRECLGKIFNIVPELKAYYDLYQLFLFHLQEKNAKHFVDLIHDEISHLNHTYSNVKLEATNKLIKDIKRNAFAYRNFENRIYLTLNIIKEKTNIVFSRA